MPIRPDDLHVGQWVAVTYQSDESDEFSAMSSMLPPWMAGPVTEDKVTGDPLKILAISLPFICVTDGDTTFALDTRTVSLTRMHKKYVREMLKESGLKPDLRKTEESKDISMACPLCGERMVEVKTPGTAWRLHCKECGFGGGAESTT